MPLVAGEGSIQGVLIWRESENSEPHLEGEGDLVSRVKLIIGITKVAIWVLGVINLLTKCPWSSSRRDFLQAPETRMRTRKNPSTTAGVMYF